MPHSSSLPPASLKRENLDEQIARSIETMIVQQHLQPGMKLPPERELAGHFGVSRPTVSVALQLLEQRGLVERKVGSGTTIKEIPHSVVSDSLKRYFRMKNCSIIDLMRFRVLIEPAATALAAANATETDMREIKDKLELLERGFDEKNVAHYAEGDIGFHKAIAIASRSEPFGIVLLAFQEIIITSIRVAAKIEWSPSGAQQHREIYNALMERDPEKACAAMTRHLEISQYMADSIPNLKIADSLT